MSTTVTPPQSAPTPPSALLTAEQFAQQYGNRYAELVEGVVKELPAPFTRHGKICATVAYLLLDHVLKQNLGHVASNDSFVKTRSNPDTVRGPDVCFYSYARLPHGEVPDGLLAVSPDLVVEVRSPSDTWTEIFAKVSEYLGVGVRAVIVVDAATTSASVYRAEELQQIFHNGDELTVPDVLPGITLRVSRLFE
jgi:Uma2 family endonuclease